MTTHRITPKNYIPLRNKIRSLDPNNIDIEIWKNEDRIFVGNDYLAMNGSCLCFLNLAELIHYFFQDQLVFL